MNDWLKLKLQKIKMPVGKPCKMFSPEYIAAFTPCKSPFWSALIQKIRF